MLRLPGPRYSAQALSQPLAAAEVAPVAVAAPVEAEKEALPPKPWQRSLNLLKKKSAASAATATVIFAGSAAAPAAEEKGAGAGAAEGV